MGFQSVRSTFRGCLITLTLAIGVDHFFPVEKLYSLYRGHHTDRPPVVAFPITEPQDVPPGIPAPIWGVPNATVPKENDWSRPAEIHDANSLDAMRAAGRIASRALGVARDTVRPGVTTDEIDAAVHEYIISQGAYPSPLYYQGYPKSICTSVNEVMVHGIPDQRPLAEGDIVTVDVTVYFRGQHADTSATFHVGKVNEAASSLTQAARKALEAAVAACGPGRPVGDLGRAVQAVADAEGYHTIRQFVGHGIGSAFHIKPRVYGFAPAHKFDVPAWLQLHITKDWTTELQPGMTLTIEPILVEGHSSTRVRQWKDGWTWATLDMSLSAQFEYTVLVQEAGEEDGQGGCEVITPYAWEKPDLVADQ